MKRQRPEQLRELSSNTRREQFCPRGWYLLCVVPKHKLECKDGRVLVPQNYNILHFTVPNYFQKVLSKTLSYSGR